MNKYLNSETYDANAPIKVDSIRFEWLEDDCADTSWLEQDYSDVEDRKEREEYLAQDRARLAAFHAGEWSMMGCRAVATVSRPIGQGSRRIETFTSSGLWGIESDCGDDYRKEVEAGQLEDLKEHLAAFGVSMPELAIA